ncbi:hypothetical protein K2Q08_02330 [Patescibacteria group bacterium]|nr:hypothetical protein [Patescibacteria group bacterium]
MLFNSYDVAKLLNENQGVISVILFVLTIFVAWASGIFKWFRNQIARRQMASRIICAWELFPDSESEEYLEYKFAPRFQNKTDEVIRDFWVNFSSSGFNLNILHTQQTSLFDGWNVRNESIQLVSKESYRFAPQNFIVPFEIVIKIRKKDLPKHGAWLYISYGVPGAKKVELDYKLSYKELNRFTGSSNKTGEDFLRYFGMTRKGFWKTKLLRQLIMLRG